jgi:cysteinyl-tRNA synthetase
MDDDFNTGEVVASVFEVVRAFNGLNLLKKAKDKNSKPTAEAFLEWMKKYGKMMALFGQDPSNFLLELDDILIADRKLDKDKIEELVTRRNEARQAKDWEAADKYRDDLSAMGIELQDGNSNRQWCVSKG